MNREEIRKKYMELMKDVVNHSDLRLGVESQESKQLSEEFAKNIIKHDANQRKMKLISKMILTTVGTTESKARRLRNKTEGTISRLRAKREAP